MELDDAFTKAALYETCVKSKILRNIDLDNVDTQTLRGLVNKYNALSLREFPIVITKVLVKFGLTFATEKMPRLRTYINPDNISVQIETDELAYLERTQSKFQPNIYMIVAKNIAVGVLGTSIQSLRELIAKTVDPNKSDESITETNTRNEVSEQSSRYKVNKIQVNSVQQTIPEITTPKRFTNFADTFKSPRSDIDAPTTPSVKRVTEQAVSVESVREKKRIDAAEKRQYQRDAVHSLHRAEIHATTTDSGADAEEEEDAFDSVSVASERTVRQPEITDTDAADVVNRFIKQQQSPPPPPPSTSPTHQQPPLSNNEELTRPLRSINANEFMSIIETNYTNLLNGEKDAAAYKHTPDEDTVKKDAAYKPTPDDDHEQRYEDDDGLRLDDGKHRYAPTPKRPPSVASSVNLTFDDDDGEDDDM